MFHLICQFLVGVLLLRSYPGNTGVWMLINTVAVINSGCVTKNNACGSCGKAILAFGEMHRSPAARTTHVARDRNCIARFAVYYFTVPQKVPEVRENNVAKRHSINGCWTKILHKGFRSIGARWSPICTRQFLLYRLQGVPPATGIYLPCSRDDQISFFFFYEHNDNFYNNISIIISGFIKEEN